MPAHIHGIDILLPPYGYHQADIGEKLGSWSTRPAQARMYRHLARQSGIENRYSVFPDLGPTDSPHLFHTDAEGRLIEPSTQTRNRYYRDRCKEMIPTLCKSLLGRCPWISSQEITHVVTVSCTGFYAPGPDIDVCNALDLPGTVERYHIGFMGCYGAFPGLRLARQISLANPGAVVLVLCIELCTLHLQMNDNPDTILSNTLFSDGAAAALVSSRPVPQGKPGFLMGEFTSGLLSSGEKDMAWEIGDRGFNMVLSSYVPDLVGSNSKAIVEDLLHRNGYDWTDIHTWAIHPGGKSILDNLESELCLAPEQLQSSRETLRRYGNMSSGTVLFVLHDVLQQPCSEPRSVCSMAFGPGLTVESVVLVQTPSATSPTPTGKTTHALTA